MTGQHGRHGVVVGSAAGALKAAATRVGLSPGEYMARRDAGLKHCFRCSDWHPVAEFGPDASRSDGLAASCMRGRLNAYLSQALPLIPPPPRGRRYVEAREGDYRQARRRVNHLVDMELLPRPNDLPCTDCGHVWTPGQLRHEYDHHLGYAAEHHEDVQAVCTTCHHDRETNRRAAA
jgi:hypothetical protein